MSVTCALNLGLANDDDFCCAGGADTAASRVGVAACSRLNADGGPAAR